ncbi:MAG: DUF4169 family protein [Bauldia sp.]|nr:DUF4169 family protein [Bauldia sp.]
MSAEIVNLRRVRKEKARADGKREAEANRAAFGRSKAEKAATRATQAAADRKLDGHRRED